MRQMILLLLILNGCASQNKSNIITSQPVDELVNSLKSEMKATIEASVESSIQSNIQGLGSYNSQFGIGAVVVVVSVIAAMVTIIIFLVNRLYKSTPCNKEHKNATQEGKKSSHNIP